jgi:hypothetical protein
MLVKVIVIVLLLAILASLFLGLVFLVNDKGRTDRTVKALTVRIILSLIAFAVLMAGYFGGFIQPHGIEPPYPAKQGQGLKN